MSLQQEFKAFLNRGSVVDLAVGVIIGAAFGKIVTSLVEDILMPPIGKIVGNLDFSNLYISLSDKITPGMGLADARKLGPVIAYGNFLTVSLNFIIVAACIFMIVKGMTALNKKEDAKAAAPAPPAPDPEDVVLLREIRDLLKTK